MEAATPDVAWQRHSWRARSACLSAGPDLFFPISTKAVAAPQIARAKSICAGCPVRSDCLSYAMADRNLQGIWGGTTVDERRRTRRSAARRASRAARAGSAA